MRVRDGRVRDAAQGSRTSRRQALRWLGLVMGTTGAALAACAVPREPPPMIKMLPQNQLDPAGLIVPRGTTVVWYNMGQLPQTVTCDPAKTKDKSRVQLPKGAQPWDSG